MEAQISWIAKFSTSIAYYKQVNAWGAQISLTVKFSGPTVHYKQDNTWECTNAKPSCPLCHPQAKLPCEIINGSRVDAVLIYLHLISGTAKSSCVHNSRNCRSFHVVWIRLRCTRIEPLAWLLALITEWDTNTHTHTHTAPHIVTLGAHNTQGTLT